MTRICIVILPSVFDSALTISRDVLMAGSRVGSKTPTFEVELLSVGGRAVRTAGGLRLVPDGALNRLEGADLALIPGFALSQETFEAVDAFLGRRECRSVMGRILRFHESGGALAAGCTATFLLAEGGLLNGRQATTSWWLAQDFERRYPKVDLQAHMMVTHDEGITCAGAALAHTDLALRVLSMLKGPAAADWVARRLLLDERISQGRYMAADHLEHRTPEALKAEAWIRAHLSEPLRVEELARAVAVSPRTLARRLHQATGESPLGFIQRIKVEHAVHLLESTDLSFEQIAARVGYREPAGLRRVMRSRTGRQPSSFRTKKAASSAVDSTDPS